jgi:hypothetical protein
MLKEEYNSYMFSIVICDSLIKLYTKNIDTYVLTDQQ